MLNRTHRACIELKTGQVLWNISSSDSIYSEEIDYIIVSKTFYSYFETKEREDTVFVSVTPTKAFHERPGQRFYHCIKYCSFPQNFHTRKLRETTAFYAVYIFFW